MVLLIRVQVHLRLLQEVVAQVGAKQRVTRVEAPPHEVEVLLQRAEGPRQTVEVPLLGVEDAR